MSQLIYIETSIPDFDFEMRPEAEIQARREWTREWWDVAQKKWRSGAKSFQTSEGEQTG